MYNLILIMAFAIMKILNFYFYLFIYFVKITILLLLHVPVWVLQSLRVHSIILHALLLYKRDPILLRYIHVNKHTKAHKLHIQGLVASFVYLVRTRYRSFDYITILFVPVKKKKESKK